ncbi:MAG: hypothetical protein WD278_04555 [Pirellulales bacterium]
MKRTLLWATLMLTSSAAQAQLMSPEKEQNLRNFFPQVESRQLQAILHDTSLILYTDEEMPPAYQHWEGRLQSVHSANFNISAEETEKAKGHGRGGNGNVEFPWSDPGGTHRSSNLFTFRFLKLPVKDGKRQSVAWFRQQLQADESEGYAWIYPVGTVFGEVLTMRGPEGWYYTFELRTRTRVYEGWEPDVFRPFPTAESLARRIKELRPDWSHAPDLVRLVEHLEHPEPELHRARLADLMHPLPDFDQWMGMDVLPPIDDPKLVKELLHKTEFRSALGQYWRIGKEQLETHAPTTLADWHIVPANYDAGFIAVDQQSCNRCHSSVNTGVRRFDAVRDWYGRIRGSDRIFSFHPFDPSCISDSGVPRPVVLRAELVSAGLLEQYDPSRHPPELYQRIAIE